MADSPFSFNEYATCRRRSTCKKEADDKNSGSGAANDVNKVKDTGQTKANFPEDRTIISARQDSPSDNFTKRADSKNSNDGWCYCRRVRSLMIAEGDDPTTVDTLPQYVMIAYFTAHHERPNRPMGVRTGTIKRYDIEPPIPDLSHVEC